MSTWESFIGLSGNGDELFTLSGTVEIVRIDVTNLGQANAADADATFQRFFKIGWWTFFDNTHGLGRALYNPIFFIDFTSNFYDPPDGVNFNPEGYGGFHFHLYPGVVANFWFRES